MPLSRVRSVAPVASALALGLLATLTGFGRRVPRHGWHGPAVGKPSGSPPAAAVSGRTKVIATLAALVVAAGAGGAAYAYKRTLDREARAIALTNGDPSRAPAHILRFGCAGCHEIPGIRGPAGRIGPPLDDIARRVYVAGMVTNTPENMVAWIVDPRAINPKTAMPVTGISQREARDVAAYLYAQ
jgi:cytochrome c2